MTGLLANCFTAMLFSQGYRMEIGAMGGTSFYSGDAGHELFRNMQPAYSLLLRYNLSRRFTVKADVGCCGIEGSTAGKENTFLHGETVDFKRRLTDATAAIEFNFYEFGAPEYVPGASRITPYVVAGAGCTLYQTDRLQGAVCLPVGIGLKYKFANRFNLGVDLTYRMTLADDLDYAEGKSFQLDDPYGVESSWNANQDSYFVLKFYLSYDFMYIGSVCYKKK